MSTKSPTSTPKFDIGTPPPTGDTDDLMLSVVVPVLNEEDSIEGALKNIGDAIERLVVKCEIIVVDNGSDDTTIEIVQRRQRH